MALTYGFFDAMLVEEAYDRLYNAGDVVEYCANIIGSGVCVTESEDSFEVTYDDGVATVAPGYLFIQGYWLKNDADLELPISGSGEFIVYAQLDTTERVIRLAVDASGANPEDSLVLARVNTTSGVVTDLRADTNVCGIIDTAGSLSDRVSAVQQYINDSITGVLAQLRSDVATEVLELNALQDEAQGIIDDIDVPVGELKFSLARLDNTWLRCDGSFISRANYPALCTVLGSHSIASRVTKLYDQNIGQYISNAVIYDGKLWFVDYSDTRLVSIILTAGEGETVGNITRYSLSAVMKCSNAASVKYFSPPASDTPLCLSVYDGRFYLAQTQTNLGYTPRACMWTISNGTIVGHTNDNFSGIAYDSTHESNTLGATRPYIAEINLGDNIRLYYANGYKVTSSGNNNYYTPEYVRCDAIMVEGITFTTASFHNYTLSQEINVFTYPHYSILGFHEKSNNGMVSALGYYDTTDRQYSLSYATHPDAQTHSGVINNWPLNSVPRGTIVPTTSAAYALCDVMRRAGGYVFTSVNLSVGTVALASVDVEVPSAATVFLESAVYAEGAFFIFTGTGLFVTKDPTDASTYSYADLTVLDGYDPIARSGCINYDSANQQLIILGVGQSGNVKVYTVSLNRWLVSSNGSYLPKVSRNGVPAYIKAVAD